MAEIEYKKIIIDAFDRLVELRRQRDELDVEQTKLVQFLYATAHMLPERDCAEIYQRLHEFTQAHQLRETSLTEAIRKVLRAAGRTWLTVSEVRGRLMESGFDFSGYVSNPLASVSTTLARLKPDEVETSTIEGVTAYRCKVLKGLTKTRFGEPPTREGVKRAAKAHLDWLAKSFGGKKE